MPETQRALRQQRRNERFFRRVFGLDAVAPALAVDVWPHAHYPAPMPQVPGHPRIAIDADTLVGKPRIAGTRIGVDLILRKLAAGTDIETLLVAYTTITRADVAAALAYAADQMRPILREDAPQVAAE